MRNMQKRILYQGTFSPWSRTHSDCGICCIYRHSNNACSLSRKLQDNDSRVSYSKIRKRKI